MVVAVQQYDPSRALPKRRRTHVVDKAVERAVELACMVRDEGRDGIAEFLDPLDREQLYALAVVLAAMVPDDQPVADLLAWTESLPGGGDHGQLHFEGMDVAS